MKLTRLMPTTEITSSESKTKRIRARVECGVFESSGVRRIVEMFDLGRGAEIGAAAEFEARIPEVDASWTIGVIIGRSGSGKTTIAREAFGDAVWMPGSWPADRAVIDCFGARPVEQIALALSAVGFSSPPSWVKPYAVLSGGERFRCELARALLSGRPLVAMDEFSSAVDRTAARIASAATARAIRSGRLAPGDSPEMRSRPWPGHFVAICCHDDIVEWLEPDWVFSMDVGLLARGRLRRPKIRLEIRRTTTASWGMFQKHHYLSRDIHPSATCFIALVDGVPAAFEAWLPFVGKLKDSRTARRGHRLVCLPDFQGVGIGSALSNSNAAMWSGLGYRVFYSTSHPAEIHNRAGRPHLWRMTRKPGVTRAEHSAAYAHLAGSRAIGRRIASFEYIGPPMAADKARWFLHG